MPVYNRASSARGLRVPHILTDAVFCILFLLVTVLLGVWRWLIVV